MITRRLMRWAALCSMLAGCGQEQTASVPGTQTLCEALTADDQVVTDEESLRSLDAVSLIDGDLIVCETSINTLSLPSLEVVRGNLILYGNQSLTAVSLPALETIGEETSADRHWSGLLVDANDLLEEMDLDSLASVSEHVWLATNPNLESFDLPSLVRVKGAITFKGTSVSQIDGFGSLRSIGNALSLVDNENLTQATGFEELVSISNDVYVSGCPELELISLPHVRLIGRYVDISGAPKLATLDMSAVEMIGHEVIITETALVNLAGLAALEIVGDFVRIGDNPALVAVSLPNLSQVTNDLTSEANDLLTRIELAALAEVMGDVAIQDNPVLDTLTAESLGRVGGNVIITGNDALPTCAADHLVEVVGEGNIGGNVSIAGNNDEGVCN